MDVTCDATAAASTHLPTSPARSALSIDALEREIGILSSHLNAATYRLLLLIAELDRREPWATFGCKTCAHYLNWKCGIALGAAREKVRTARALADLPLISQAFGAGRISYSKARALTRVANEHNEPMLLELALAGSGSGENVAGSRTADRFQVKITAPVSGLAAAEPETASASASASASEILAVLDDGPALSIHTIRRLCCDGTVIPILEDDEGNPLRIGRKTRTVSPALRRAVNRRDGGCRFPGCTQTRHVDAHHIVHWADGGPTNLENLVSLCRKHHTWVHEGSFTVRAAAEGSPEFRNRYGVPMQSNGQRRLRGNVQALIEQNEALGLEITANTAEPSWDGKPADYDHIMFVLGQHLPEPRSAPEKANHGNRAQVR